VRAIALLLTLIVGAIALLHFYWAAGGLWPGRTPKELAYIVVGNPRIAGMPPPWLSALVATLIAGAAAWPLLLAPVVSHHLAPSLAAAGSFGLAALFLLRGAAGYTAAMAKRHSAEPFASYNRKFYSPLCLVLGVGYLIFAFHGATP
jgi:hypothetical protein